MRIMQVITRRQLRGAEIFASQLSAELIKMGHHVVIVAIQAPAEFPLVDGCEYVDFNEPPSKRLISYNAWKNFHSLIKKWKPDIIQANASETLKFTVMSKFFFKWKVPVVYRNANKVSDFIKSPFSKWVNTWLTQKINFVISVSEICRMDFIETFGMTLSKIETIPIGTPAQAEAASTETKLAPPGYWINVGSLVPEKNHSGLLRIFRLYFDQGGKRNLLIVGDGKLRQELIQLSQSLNISSRVFFLGYRKDASALMREAHCLLLPSIIEGLPGVILEAMANKIPVIAAEVGGIPEVIENEITGLLIKKNDEAAFADAMIMLERNEVLRKEIIARAFTLCKTKYNIELIADRFLNVYKRILDLDRENRYRTVEY